MVALLGFVTAGCQSELEIHGLRDVLAVPGLPAPQLQYRVDLPGGPVRLDAAWPDLKIAVEFDGAAFHGDLASRERDLRRDAAVHRQRAGLVPQPRISAPGMPGPGSMLRPQRASPGS